MEIREVRDDEVDALGELTVRVYEAIGATDEAYTPELRNVRARMETCTVLVAIVDGRLAGGVTYVPEPGPYADIAEPGEASFRMLVVDPELQGRGIGRALVDACIARATAAGRSGIVILSDPEMVVAHGMYERMGFHRTTERDFVYRPDVVLRCFTLPL